MLLNYISCRELFDQATYALILNAILQFRRDVIGPAALIIRVRHIFQTAHVKPEFLSAYSYGNENFLKHRNKILANAIDSFMVFLPSTIRKVAQPKYIVGMMGS
jgi:hypothetical protein